MKELFEEWKRNYTGDPIDYRLDDEIINFTYGEEWEEEYENEFDYYNNFSNGEAEEVVAEEIIDEIEGLVDYSFTCKQRALLLEIIFNEYEFLRY